MKSISIRGSSAGKVAAAPTACVHHGRGRGSLHGAGIGGVVEVTEDGPRRVELAGLAIVSDVGEPEAIVVDPVEVHADPGDHVARRSAPGSPGRPGARSRRSASMSPRVRSGIARGWPVRSGRLVVHERPEGRVHLGRSASHAVVDRSLRRTVSSTSGAMMSAFARAPWRCVRDRADHPCRGHA